ncbi:potassium channel protein [Synechococcales cyanobacterium C]|uniref:Potassium channel protein n=1 Tax=Petrachloros mirabilis ULC683 TaxID=2781853 RepID=A0A8K2A7B0_9CYAN|nr:NAD-binding protein [Petrachloros mirabilis]NCJ06711.1 potassium channel protein [Petrachloros mirabilis ULC683]
MPPQIIVCGLGAIGDRIVQLLRQQSAHVVGVNDCSRPELSDIIVGPLQSPETLLRAGIKSAQTLIIATNDDAVNLEILMQARLLNPRLRIINRLFNQGLGERLDRTLADHTTMSVAALSAPLFGFAAVGNRAIGQLRLFEQVWPIYEEQIHAHHPWRDRKLSDLWDDRSRMLIYYLAADREIDLVSGVLSGQRLQAGDRLILGSQPRIRVTRSSWLRKLLKMGVGMRQFQRHSRAVGVVLMLLLATIALATLTYTHFSYQSSSLVDALYFSVGMITGAGGQESVAEQSADWIKVFTVVMMLLGAGVIGICYALLNDLVLGTRLRHFWDVARVPHRDHFIVCGLGGVGIQIVNHLRANGYEVVVVERDPNSRFLQMARSQKVPVIIGDANLPVTLQTANLKHAAALLTVTQSDMVNLEIGLTVKNLAPQLPVIVRCQDPQQAERMQRVFEFNAVLSPPELAAPAFAAAALGGRILGNGITADSLWIALSLLITPSHPFRGMPVKAVATSADLVPLYLESQRQTIHGWALLQKTLSPGDVLHLTIPAIKIESLWRLIPTVVS